MAVSWAGYDSSHELAICQDAATTAIADECAASAASGNSGGFSPAHLRISHTETIAGENHCISAVVFNIVNR